MTPRFGRITWGGGGGGKGCKPNGMAGPVLELAAPTGAGAPPKVAGAEAPPKTAGAGAPPKDAGALIAGMAACDASATGRGPPMGVRGAAANACCPAAEPLMSIGASAGAIGSAGGPTTLGLLKWCLLASHHLNDMKQRYAMLACAMKSETL